MGLLRTHSQARRKTAAGMSQRALSPRASVSGLRTIDLRHIIDEPLIPLATKPLNSLAPVHHLASSFSGFSHEA
jgi:hypothetical protein